MTRINLKIAFSLLSDYKQGLFNSEDEINDAQVFLIELLCKDLLPCDEFSINELSSIIEKIVRADSEWNKKAQLTISAFYSIKELGNKVKAQKIKDEFLDSCPSDWYRGIIEAL